MTCGVDLPPRTFDLFGVNRNGCDIKLNLPYTLDVFSLVYQIYLLLSILITSTYLFKCFVPLMMAFA